MRQLIAAKVESVEKISADAYVVSFNRNFEFKAGQVICLTTDRSIEPRIYSIASGEKDDCVKILFNVKQEGKLTPKLAVLSVGDEIYYSEPFGSFLIKNTPAWLIAVGTGIAPFVSMLYSGKGSDKKLIYGAKSVDSFYFGNVFIDNYKENFIRCCSRQSADGVFFGRVTDYLLTCDDLPCNIDYYICGSPETIVDVRDLLIGKGIDYNRIISETYF